ncbi:MAG: rhodanese-like domain-containing protein [Ignavibacterium sp.]|nr:rhodanese-like domain-containing protein [Ignavibacterium sp.]
MEAGQIFLYLIIALIGFYIIRKVLVYRSVKHYSPVDASVKLKKERKVVLLDVRTDMERKQDSIKGSYHIPLMDLSSSENELKKFKDAEIICYCRTGNRSMNAAAKLKKMGFNAANLSRGIIGWKAAGLR